MPTQSTEKPRHSARFRLAVLLGFIVAGLAGNYLKFPIFLNIDFLFGSIFAMLALQFLGFVPGVIAAGVIAGYTYVLWNHPYAIVIMTAEVAVVGWLTKYRKTGFVLADTIYWLLLGMPLVVVFYYGVMHLGVSNTYITMTKQAVNGIANALVARLVFTTFALRTRFELVSYRETVYNMLALFVLAPVLLLLALQSRIDFAETDRQIRTKLTQDCRSLADGARLWVRNRKTSVTSLAQMASTSSPQEMQPRLEQAVKADTNFLRMGLLDGEATVTAYFPLQDELGQRNIGKNFADRPFVADLKRTLQPMLSEVVMGRIGTPKPMVTMLAPVIRKGAYAGYVTGILSLEQVRSLLELAPGEPGLRYTLLDRNGAVVMTTRPDQKIMAPFVQAPGAYRRLGEGIGQWVPDVTPNTSISERWQKSYYIADATVGDFSEWRLILEQPVAPFQKALYSRYANLLSLLFLILLGALAVAEFCSRKGINTFEKLGQATQDLPNRLAMGEGSLAWQESGIQEANQLINNFRQVAESLARQYQEVREVNASLEQRVEERTAELHSESTRLQTLLTTATDGIHVLDMEGNLVLHSPSFAEMLGYGATEMPVGLNVRDWDATNQSQKMFEYVRDNGDATKTFETQYRRKDGLILDVEVSTRGLSLNGKTHVYNSARDITKRKRDEAALAAAKRQAEEANRSKSQFLANMSHEIRTPLAGIVGTTRLLAQTKLDDAQQQLVEMAQESSGALLEVLNDILDFSKIEAGQMPLRSAPFDLLLLLESVSAPYRLLAREKGLRFDLSVAPPTPKDLIGDDGRLGQVLRNLLSNALKFTEGGGITLSVVPVPTADSGTVTLCFTVTDTGMGISPAYLPHIFDSFSQADSSYGKQHAGTGLGLAISKSFVEQMGGSLNVSSQPEAGSTFTFTAVFGRQDLAAAEPQDTEDRASSLDNQAAAMPHLRVLLAEDNVISRILVEHMVRAAGHEIVSVGDGHAVLRLLAEQEFDIVFMDMQMPGMDGVTATRQIRRGALGEKKAGTPLVALTAYAAREDHLHFLEAGVDEVVTKPAEEAALFAAARRALLKANRSAQKAQGAAPDSAALQPRFDIGYIKRTYEGRQDLLDQMLQQFREASLPKLTHALVHALDSGDRAVLERTTHQAKGALGSLGAARGAQLAHEAEIVTRAGADPRAAVNALLAELESLKPYLEGGAAWGQG
ncbi:MAG: response regulator [Desulfovibrio sp.]|jgi:PAS domain S-box-containing protein|nr:response regulator [Desulfovibrio sp.]